MLIAIRTMLTPVSKSVNNGRVDLSNVNFTQNELVLLNGYWEFYWDRLLTTEDFVVENPPQMDSLMEVPSTWDEKSIGIKGYPERGFATYRLRLTYPSTLKDPALHIKNVATAYRLYVNGKLMEEVGEVSDELSNFKDEERSIIIELPNDKKDLEIIFQVANLKYAKGGLREGPLFGSKQVLEQQKLSLLALQLLFIGSVFIFGVYYFILFLLQKKNKTALFFSMLCFITVLRSLIWGEAPIEILFPQVTYVTRVYINYFTGFNLMPIIILFMISIYPLDYKKIFLMLVLLPTIFINLLLLIDTEVMSSFSIYLYMLVLLHMIYIFIILVKAVINKRDNALLMLICICIFILTIIQDIFHYKRIGGINLTNMFLYGNLVIIIAMSYVQAKKQADTHKKLVLFNENLVEADRLKDKIMSTEMSFLQAQIKPHFLYNALNAIANICEKDGKEAGKLIIDLAIYLQGSLEFNNLDKMITIEKELEFVDTYFNIEQARFGQKIQIVKEIKIPLDYQIPILVLQPLVENAVRHGISKKIDGGTVWVRMRQLDEGICIEIQDDGGGIDSEKLSMLLKADRKDCGVGLLNIHNRLLRLYGRGLEISSEVKRYTCVRLVIQDGRKNYDKDCSCR